MKTFLLITLFSFWIDVTFYAQNGWHQVDPGFGHSYTSVNFIDINTGMACGTNGTMIKSTNGGLTWTILNSGVTVNLNGVIMFSSTTAIAVGDSRTIIRTTNGGLVWSVISQNFIDNLTAIDLKGHGQNDATFISASMLSPYQRKQLGYTTDSGANWQFNIITNSPQDASFINVSTGWQHYTVSVSGGTSHYISKSTNSGINWSPVWNAVSSWPPWSIWNFRMVDSLCGFVNYNSIVGNYMDRTTDGGFSWIDTYGTDASPIIHAYFVASGVGYLITESKIYFTANSGANFEQQYVVNQGLLKQIHFVNPNVGWVATTLLLLKTTNGGFTGIIKSNNEIPEKFSLHQNYPNPFNPVTNIKFQIPSVGQRHAFDTKLIVYDISGRLVTTLVNEQLQPGSYSVDWDGTGYASGVYFYSLVTSEFTETKRMVLVK